jgi:hypothetical protein
MCERTFTNEDHLNRLSVEKEHQLRTLIEAGLSVRAIQLLLGVGRATVSARRPSLSNGDLHQPMCSNKNTQCHYCGAPVGKKEFQRRAARTKHQFCDSECYQSYYLATDPERLARYLERMVTYG